MTREQMTIVIVGHVDHGKSTVIGRLLADTNSLPQGKLAQVQQTCKKNSKPFEYAFLLDALKDEQSQGITIDSARCFFKTQKRDYLVFDAPGHREFLKNMITGAAHAQAALLVIDAYEGIQENSKRHGALLSMLGISQVAVLVNKMDLIGYNQQLFATIKEEFTTFLHSHNVTVQKFIPITALAGGNIATIDSNCPWYDGPTVVEQLDAFITQSLDVECPLRFPLQDIYKFTEDNDDRRIAAGTIQSGKISVGDEIIFLPSRKKTMVKSIESFNTAKKTSAYSNEAIGITFTTQIYVKPGELMVHCDGSQPFVSTRLCAHIFWMGRVSLQKGKSYKLKLATTRVVARIIEIKTVLDAENLQSVTNKQCVERHDVAEVIIETEKPIAFDTIHTHKGTSRFVLVDTYDIVGGGIILESVNDYREKFQESLIQSEKYWIKGTITQKERSKRFGHKPQTILLCGAASAEKNAIAQELEKLLFLARCNVVYLGIAHTFHSSIKVASTGPSTNDEAIRKITEISKILNDSGMIFITTISDIDEHDLDKLRIANQSAELLVIAIGDDVSINSSVCQLTLPAHAEPEVCAKDIVQLLKNRTVLDSTE